VASGPYHLVLRDLPSVANLPGYRPFDPAYGYLFNSYYEALGPRQPRPQRGLLTRPSVGEILAYRRHVDAHMSTLLKSDLSTETEALLRLGLAHEEQHQELLLMDLLHLFSQSPITPAYDRRWPADEPGRSGRFKRLPAAWWRSEPAPRRSPSTTKGRVTRSGCSHLKSATGW